MGVLRADRQVKGSSEGEQTGMGRGVIVWGSCRSYEKSHLFHVHKLFFRRMRDRLLVGGDLASREGFYEERRRHAFWQRAKSQEKMKG